MNKMMPETFVIKKISVIKTSPPYYKVAGNDIQLHVTR